MLAMIRDLDMTLIRTFVTTADKASMTAAANALHLTQGAVSQQVKRLEEVLGQSLFERDRRGLRLTRSGERLLDKATRLLRLNDEILTEIKGGVVAGQVRIGVPYDLVGTLLAPVLKAAGYRVTVAQSGQEGLGVLRSGGQCDVILTDIEMPDMNGFEFAETIRADQKLNDVPIIALSSMISPAAIERGRQAGFHDYVAKFDRPGLIAALKEQTSDLNRAA